MLLFNRELKSGAASGELDHEFFECEYKLAATDDQTKDGTIEGYASVFNLMDRGGDIVLPGAFKASLADWRKKKAMPAMLWQHYSDQPIGVWTGFEEDEKGLKATGELIMEVPQGAVAYALLKRKAIKGLSIGYRTLESDTDRTTGVRSIMKAELWEVSVCTFPLMPEANVTSVKGESIVPSDRELEAGYREGGLSQREAKIAVAITKKMVLREGGRPDPAHREGAADVITTLRRAEALFK